jgi:peptide deformylase
MSEEKKWLKEEPQQQSAVVPVLEIRQFPDTFLRTPALPWTEGVDSPTLKPIVASMKATVKAYQALGLAGPQVGFGYRVIVLRDFPFVLINPTIKTVSPTEATDAEGCLSFPGSTAKVKRPQGVVVEFTNEAGQVVELPFTGLTARCIQHEVDHLNGETFLDRIPKIHRKKVIDDMNGFARKVKRYEKAVSAAKRGPHRV